MRPRDMAKIGYLYLNNGVWDGQQLLSAEWVEQSQQKYVLNEGAYEPWDEYYGYGWWVHEIGAYAAHGYRGQFIYVIPHLDMVVVMTGGLEDSQFVEPELIIRDIIMTAVENN